MTTSQEKPFLSTLLPRERPPEFVLGYLASSFLTRMHERLLSIFLALEERKQISKAEIARRLDKDPAVINRWLSGPGNWELRTVSDIAAAMGYEPDIRFVRIQAETDEESAASESLANRPAANDDPTPPQFPSREQPERHRLQQMYG